jgi:hypothetical protein
MDFIVLPYTGAGVIKLGMNQTEVRQILSGKVSEIFRAAERWDVFNDFGIQVHYGSKAPKTAPVCRAIMLGNPENPIFQDRVLLNGASIKELKEWFELIDDSVEVATEGIVSYKFGIYLSTQDYEIFSHQSPESIVVFERGYYDELR